MKRITAALTLLAILPAPTGGWEAATSTSAQPVLVVITGVGGEARFDERFHTWATTLMDAAVDRYGLPEEHVVYLAADPDRDPGRARARSTRDNVRSALRDLAGELAAEAPLFVVVIGHGSFRDGVSKVNLPGPDMTAEDFAAALAPFGERPVMFANLASASGEFVRALSAPGRTVITATKSGMERNVSIFAQFFVAAFVGDDADVDNDERLSVLEAFNYARREVERDYERSQKLRSEHALLDDNGDGEGSAEPAIEAADGRLAATLMLTGVAQAAADSSDPRRMKKAELEADIAELRRRKQELSREEYEDQLEQLLVELALVNRALREAE